MTSYSLNSLSDETHLQGHPVSPLRKGEGGGISAQSAIVTNAEVEDRRVHCACVGDEDDGIGPNVRKGVPVS